MKKVVGAGVAKRILDVHGYCPCLFLRTIRIRPELKAFAARGPAFVWAVSANGSAQAWPGALGYAWPPSRSARRPRGAPGLVAGGSHCVSVAWVSTSLSSARPWARNSVLEDRPEIRNCWSVAGFGAG